jgi:multiple sugar transport system substrate-binding protein
MTPRPTRRLALALPALLAAPLVARAQAVEITIQYAQPHVFKDSKDAVAAAFARREPGIRINWVTTPNYDEGLQLVLRQAVAGGSIDLSYQGLNRLRAVAERGLAQDLAPFLAREGDPAAQGYTPQLLGLGRIGDMQAGLAYAASNNIVYANADLLRRAGTAPEAFPTSWDGVFELCQRIARSGGGADPFFYDWQAGEWYFASLFLGHGGRWMSADERRFQLESPEGLGAMRLFDRMVREARMPNLSTAQALQAFGAGSIGIRVTSTAFLRNMIQAVGRNFTLATTVLPVIDPVRGRIPVGGSAGVLLARDPARQEAAWKFLRFSTSAEGTALMVRNTGYVPCNQIAVDDQAMLADFYRDNPLFAAATRQLPITVEWYAFPGANGVRISATIADNLARIVEGRATPEQVVADTQREVTRLLPRQS